MRRAGQALLDRTRTCAPRSSTGPTATRCRWSRRQDDAALAAPRPDRADAASGPRRSSGSSPRTAPTTSTPAAPPLIRLALADLEPGRARTGDHRPPRAASTAGPRRCSSGTCCGSTPPTATAAGLPAVRDYGDFLAWRARQDRGGVRPRVGGRARRRRGADAARRRHRASARAPRAAPRSPSSWTRGLAADLGRRAAESGRHPQHPGAGRLGAPARPADRPAGRGVRRHRLRAPARGAGRRVDGRDVHQHRARCASPTAPGDAVADVLTRLQSRQAALLDHHHHGLTEIQQAVGLPTLFDTLVVFESYPIDREGLEVRRRRRGRDRPHRPAARPPARTTRSS